MENCLDELEIEENNNLESIPCITDPEWSNYVLSFFKEDEMFKGNPTVDGLRRVAELLLGEIVEQRTAVIQAPDNNDKRATVVHSISFAGPNDLLKRFEGAADVYWGNCDKPFYKYPVSTAETRAEGRALKRALKLKKVVVAEELSEVALQDEPSPDENNQTITDVQLNFLDIISNRINVNLTKLIAKEHPNVKQVKQLKHSESLVLQKLLSEYQQNTTKIPSELIGYSNDWKTANLNQTGD